MPKKKQLPKWLRKRVFDRINPYGYMHAEERIKDVFGRKSKTDDSSISSLSPTWNFNNFVNKDNQRKDAWAKYLGLQQPHETFTTSEYKPSKSKDKDSKYYKYQDSDNEVTQMLQTWGEHLSKYSDEQLANLSSTEGTDFGLGHYKVDFGKDEKGKYVSAYDKWDLHPFKGSNSNMGSNKFIGKFLEKNKEKDIGSLLRVGEPWE